LSQFVKPIIAGRVVANLQHISQGEDQTELTDNNWLDAGYLMADKDV